MKERYTATLPEDAAISIPLPMLYPFAASRQRHSGIAEKTTFLQ
jgi:hypothetical protein